MLKDWIWLTTRKGLGARGVLQVLDYFGSPERAFYADPEQYDQIPGLSALARSSLREKGMEGPDRILGECDRLGLRVLTLQDGDYPERLREIPDPPAVLYIRGTLFHFDQEAAIGIVGAREPSPYGEKVAAQLGLELARNGVLLVSGIAQGIDSIALKGALQGGGRVVSVLAGGVDVPYPWQNRYLYEDVAAAGALISEYPPGTRHNGEHFPVRNRIISGLSLGVVVVEAALRSGSLITARLALEQNRAVYAVPGGIGSKYAEGCQKLIRDGAQPIFSFSDILSDLSAQLKTLLPQPDSAPRPYSLDVHQEPFQSAPAAPPPLRQPDRSTLEGRILTLLAQSPRAIDDVCQSLGCDPGEAGSTLIILEVRGLIRQRPDLRYALT